MARTRGGGESPEASSEWITRSQMVVSSVRLTPGRAISSMSRFRTRLAVLLLAACAFPRVVAADSPLTVDVDVGRPSLSLGDRTEVIVSVRLQPGWHVNSHRPELDFLIPTTIEFDLPHGVELARVDYPEPVRRKLESLLNRELELYEGTFQIRAELAYRSAVRAGRVGATLRYQACNDKVCLRPASLVIPVDLQLLPANSGERSAGGEGAARKAAGVTSLPWIDFSTEAYDSARKNGAPFVIEFAAEWCAPCKEMERRTFRDPEVVEAGRGLTFLSVDMTEPDDYVERVLRSFDIISAPTTIFFGVDGKEFTRRGGFIGPEEFAALLRESWQGVEPPSALEGGKPI